MQIPNRQAPSYLEAVTKLRGSRRRIGAKGSPQMTTDFAPGSLEFAIIDQVERQDGVTLERQYAERYELVAQAEQYGFTAYHVTEHHLTPLDMAPSPIVYLAALAQHT